MLIVPNYRKSQYSLGHQDIQGNRRADGDSCQFTALQAMAQTTPKVNEHPDLLGLPCVPII